eukprot:4855951-Pleurochrysis_carterae.AAC.3
MWLLNIVPTYTCIRDATVKKLNTLHPLEEYRRRRVQLDGVHVPWAVENVLGAKSTVSEMFYAPTVLCGTMYGHSDFRHRLFLSSDKLQLHLSCVHEGKHVGSRGHSKDKSHPSNMYGPYSWHRAFRGSTGDLHFAVGFEPGSFTYRGLTQELPVSYGCWVCSQLIATSMRLYFDLLLFSREELPRNPLLNERVVQWEIGGARGNLLHWNESLQGKS